jgi:ABC-type multidrug transport system fused ATPase/permease subunit
VRPYRFATTGLFSLLLAGVLVELVPPKLQQYLVDHVLQADRQSAMEGFVGTLAIIVMSLAVTRIVAALVSEWKGVLAHRIGTPVRGRGRHAVHAQLGARALHADPCSTKRPATTPNPRRRSKMRSK